MEEILQNKKFRKALETIADKQSLEFDDVLKESESYLKEMYSIQNPMIGMVGVEIAQYVISRAYDKSIDVNQAELKKLSKMMRRHSVAFVMTHKTYIDMFVLGVVLAKHGLPLPYIFGGINMAFLGLGELGRKSGAIFIRRSFKDNEIYKVTLRQFISSIVDAKKHFMWSIEGTRSRTGKLVWPKMGILKYIHEAETVSKNDVKYIPVSIVYDLIPDVKDMIKEGRGKMKRQESLMWFMNYLKKMGEGFGKISIRFGDHIDIKNEGKAALPLKNTLIKAQKGNISKLAFELVHNINEVTPVTSSSLVCIALLSKFALNKIRLESIVGELMSLVEGHKADAMVDRGRPIGQSIQNAINLLDKSGIIQHIGQGDMMRYSIVPEHYLTATYYSNMAVHHLYHRAFVELAILHIDTTKSKDRMHDFWIEIMRLRNLFKFEFFYSNKKTFVDEIELDLSLLDPEWASKFASKSIAPISILENQKILIAPVVLSTYVEAYKVVGRTLENLDNEQVYSENEILQASKFFGEEMHWKGKIHRVDSVSKPFLLNGIRLASNLDLIPDMIDNKADRIQTWNQELEYLSSNIKIIHDILPEQKQSKLKLIPIDKKVVPGSKTAGIIEEVMASERGPHIGAYFDLDRTLISGFSAKEFFQTRLLSGQMTSKELIAQFSGLLVYAVGNKNFAGLASIGAKGIKGIKENVFLEVGEEVYLKHLSKNIYPESRALVDAHFAMGHTVAIISAATPYQVNPVARDLGIEEILCTHLEVVNGTFTGEIMDPPCWGEGKAIAGKKVAKKHDLDLSKSYFYTDSMEDFPLLELVGNPRPVNPDIELSKIAFENDWPIFRFDDVERPGLQHIIRSVFAFGSLIPAAFAGLFSGTMNMSWKEGVNSMIAVIGDLGTKLSGIQLVVKGKDNLWKNRPAVFIFNHQSNADLLIVSKLVRKDTVPIAKIELKYSPVGPLFTAAGVIFIDRSNREKAIEAMKPAIDALHNGTSIAIAPEGTRSYNYQLGKFKKGAFHLAMQAQVPIVPIVIKNAHDVMPRGSSMMQPTIVQVVVLDPISTKSWTKNNLNDKISDVRNQYLEKLEQLEE